MSDASIRNEARAPYEQMALLICARGSGDTHERCTVAP